MNISIGLMNKTEQNEIVIKILLFCNGVNVTDILSILSVLQSLRWRIYYTLVPMKRFVMIACLITIKH